MDNVLLDVLEEQINNNFAKEDYDTVNTLLAKVKVSDVPMVTLLAYLKYTKSKKEFLTYRQKFIDEVKVNLEKRIEDFRKAIEELS